ncbi:MAG: hypothetical protein P8J86_11115 [Phycisphaerales bacterium]|jgi:hypothetical protein|nr:hypothetical protein [Phycisphaerales bacterium]
MFKLLRKYDKWILAVGGTLLLIAFLMPQAIQGLSRWAGSQTGSIATVGTNQDAVSQSEFEMIRRQLEWLQATGNTNGFPAEVQTPEHWYLLVREADQAGMIGDLPTLQMTERDEAERRRIGLSKQEVYAALANLAGTRRVMALYASGNAISSNRLMSRGRELFTTIDADIAVIEANAELSTHEPTDEELETQLAAYADDKPGDGERGFGYKLPNRVKVEWLSIPEQDIREKLAASPTKFNEVELYKHWRRNSDNPSFGPVDADIEIPEAVRNDLLDSLTTEQMNLISRYASSELAAPTRRVPRKGDFFELPEDWSDQRLSLQELAEAIKGQFGVSLPTYSAADEQWTPVAKTGQFDGLGDTTNDQFGQGATSIQRLLQETKEFNGSGKYQIQTGMYGPPMRAENGDLYLFRITDSDPARAPASIDEVRDDVTNDIRRVDSYKHLTERSDALTNLAIDQGLLNFTVTEDAEVAPKEMITLYNPIVLNYQLQQGGLLRPIARPLPKIGAHTEAVSSIVNRAILLSDSGPLKDQPLTDRTFVLPVDDKMALLVVQLNDIQPLDTQMYGNLTHSGALQNMMAIDELDPDEMSGVFSYEGMANRHNFELLGNTDEETDDSETTSDATDNS